MVHHLIMINLSNIIKLFAINVLIISLDLSITLNVYHAPKDMYHIMVLQNVLNVELDIMIINVLNLQLLFVKLIILLIILQLLPSVVVLNVIKILKNLFLIVIRKKNVIFVRAAVLLLMIFYVLNVLLVLTNIIINVLIAKLDTMLISKDLVNV